jgi:hypothetical protein
MQPADELETSRQMHAAATKRRERERASDKPMTVKTTIKSDTRKVIHLGPQVLTLGSYIPRPALILLVQQTLHVEDIIILFEWCLAT